MFRKNKKNAVQKSIEENFRDFQERRSKVCVTCGGSYLEDKVATISSYYDGGATLSTSSSNDNYYCIHCVPAYDKIVYKLEKGQWNPHYYQWIEVTEKGKIK